MKKIVFYLFLASSVFALNRGDIRTVIRQKLKDVGPTSSEYYYSDSELNTRINLVQRDICFRTDAMRRFFYINASTDTRTYVLNADVLKIYSVCFEDKESTGTFKKLDYTNEKALWRDYTNWEDLDSGEPLEWYQIFSSTWATSELRIGLKPPPSSVYTSTNGYTLRIRIEASEQADDMTSDSDIPFNGNPRLYALHTAIIYGVCAMINENTIYDQKYRELIEIGKANMLEIPAREGGVSPRRR